MGLAGEPHPIGLGGLRRRHLWVAAARQSTVHGRRNVFCELLHSPQIDRPIGRRPGRAFLGTIVARQTKVF